ncbi:zf-TFIIB domain containing protein, partial [Streptomyces parvus]
YPPAPPAAHAPAWGAPQHGGHYGHRRQKGFGRMLFSS